MALSVPRARPHERVTAAYFTLTAAFVLITGASLAEWWPILLLHAAAIALLLLVLPRLGERGWPSGLRDWLLVPGLLLIYAEVGILNDLFTDAFYDRPIAALDTLMFGSQPAVTLRERLPWWLLSEYVHFGYFGYYILLPGLAAALYWRRRYGEYRYMLTITLATFFFCYLCFIVFPVAGPWFLLERPDPNDLGWIFPQLVHRVLGAGGMLGLTFPSSHVAAAVTLWMLAWQFVRPLFWWYSAIVPALIVGTVYGGFHYASDAVFGVLVGVLFFAGGPLIWRVFGGGPLPPDIPGGGPPPVVGSSAVLTTPSAPSERKLESRTPGDVDQLLRHDSAARSITARYLAAGRLRRYYYSMVGTDLDRNVAHTRYPGEGEGRTISRHHQLTSRTTLPKLASLSR